MAKYLQDLTEELQGKIDDLKDDVAKESGGILDAIDTALDNIYDRTLTNIEPSDNERLADDTTETVTGVAYLKYKEFIVGISGQWRFTWENRTLDVGTNENMSLMYKNGSPHPDATEQQGVNSGEWQTETEELWYDKGDYAQLYSKNTNAGDESEIKNFKAKGDLTFSYGVEM